MILAVPAEVVEKLPERALELIGYSIHPPFMGHVDGVPSQTIVAGKPPIGGATRWSCPTLSTTSISWLAGS
jgi:hypothetical protein